MWIVRELLRLLERVAVAIVIAAAVGGLWSLAQSGNAGHRLQISFIVIGAIVVMLGAMGGGSSYARFADARAGRGANFVSGLVPRAASTGPQLAPGAVLLLSGAIVIALGFLV